MNYVWKKSSSTEVVTFDLSIPGRFMYNNFVNM